MFANIVKEKRSARDLSQRQLGDLVGVTQQAVGRWETGQAFPDTAILLRLADLFDLSVDQLLGRAPKPAPIEIEISPQQYSNDEQALIEKYRRMKDHEKDTMHKVADTIAPDEQVATFAKGC